MASYVALLRKEKKSDYSVSFPDFPGCVTAGKTLDEAHRFAVEALAFHIEGMEADGDPIPAPTTLDVIAADPEHRDAFATIVSVTPRSKVQRLNITMSTDTLQRIDAYAEEIGMTRSAFLAHAALQMLGASGRGSGSRNGAASNNGTRARPKNDKLRPARRPQ